MSTIQKTSTKSLEQQQEQRATKGAALYADGAVCETDFAYYVQSETNPETVYMVSQNPDTLQIMCECPDYERRVLPCKHLWAVEYIFINGNPFQQYGFY